MRNSWILVWNTSFRRWFFSSALSTCFFSSAWGKRRGTWLRITSTRCLRCIHRAAKLSELERLTTSVFLKPKANEAGRVKKQASQIQFFLAPADHRTTRDKLRNSKPRRALVEWILRSLSHSFTNVPHRRKAAAFTSPHAHVFCTEPKRRVLCFTKQGSGKMLRNTPLYG